MNELTEEKYFIKVYLIFYGNKHMHAVFIFIYMHARPSLLYIHMYVAINVTCVCLL